MKHILIVMMSILFLALGIYMQFYLTKGFIETTAVITNIETKYNGEDEEYHVFVKYTVDDKTYEGESNVYIASYKVGKTITIFYDPNDPANFKGDAGFIGWILIGIGSVIFVASILTVALAITKARR